MPRPRPLCPQIQFRDSVGLNAMNGCYAISTSEKNSPDGMELCESSQSLRHQQLVPG